MELEIVTELARCRFKIERGEALASSLIDLRIAADWDLNCHHHPPLTDTQHVALAYNAEAIRPGLPYLERQIERSQRHWVRLITTLERIRRFQRQDQNLSTPTTHYDPLPVPEPWAHQQDDDPPPPPPAPEPAQQKNQQANPSPADLPQNQQPPESVEEDQTQPSPGS
ncbi:MAG: hypothetical protein SFV54_16505 [Bryobacteraceae bacterium]|nr:hypothetical protein [Bryobacteraceae bacterium]